MNLEVKSVDKIFKADNTEILSMDELSIEERRRKVEIMKASLKESISTSPSCMKIHREIKHTNIDIKLLSQEILKIYKKSSIYNPVTEEATKQWMILPLIQRLGYDIFSNEVIPEYTADIGTKSGERLDYLLTRMNDSKILVECKATSIKLSNKQINQLYRYYSALISNEMCISCAVLTNGIEYQFFTDNKVKNVMDLQPYFIFNISNNSYKTVEKFANILGYTQASNFGDIRDDARFCDMPRALYDITKEYVIDIIRKEFEYYKACNQSLLLNELQEIKKIYQWYKSQHYIPEDTHIKYIKELKQIADTCDNKLKINNLNNI